MANHTQGNDAASRTQPPDGTKRGPQQGVQHGTQQPEPTQHTADNADEASALEHPPVEQKNPDHDGLNPDHLGPAQPRKPGE